ncbi:MAG TPA: hypothetical protein VGI82_01625 [Chitinophagaceae bacterium]|jgi:hypothetical protein
MDIKKIGLLLPILFNLAFVKAIAQNIKHIDPSKPTNLYNRLSNNLEYNFLGGSKRTYGYRANLVLASADQHHALHIEIPLLYATSSNKFGLGDLRVRYYWIPYKKYSKMPGAFGFIIDSYVPTGNFSDGLGRGRWIVAPGITSAFVFGKFSTFPVIAYLYSGKIMSSKISASARKALNGYIIQSTFVYKFKKSYIDCTPIFMKNSYSNGGRNDFVVESNFLYMLKPNKIQIGCFERRYFLGSSTTLRGALRIYF